MTRALELARAVAGRALTAIVGAVVTAGLFTAIPAEESGRTVEARPQADGTVTVRHVAARQYLAAYRDIVGVWTICDGLTVGVTSATHETEAGCMIRLERELVEHATRIRACVPQLFARGREQQLLASISLSYNIGWPSFCASTAARRFKAAQWATGCDAFAMWDKAGRPLRAVRGLALRRAREIRVCRTGL